MNKSKSVDPLAQMQEGDVPFMLKSKRIEYTLEYFANILRQQLR